MKLKDPETRYRALYNGAVSYPQGGEYKSLQQALIYTFKWAESPEGHKFWSNLIWSL